MAARTIFLLSPAHCGRKRAQMVMNPNATFPLAVALRETGAPLGDVFSFLSGLYFRGKLAYARAFASGGDSAPDIFIITSGRGLVRPDQRITLADLREMAAIEVSLDDPRYREPLQRDAAALAAGFNAGDRVVLLGSIATGKYVDAFEEPFGGALLFPEAFVGRGDMSRGGLMLRCVAGGGELTYRPVAGAIRHGARPPRLERVR